MIKKFHYLIIFTVLLVLVVGSLSVSAIGKGDYKFKIFSDGIVAKQSNELQPSVEEGYTIDDTNQLKKMTKETVKITVNQGSDKEYSLDLVKFKENNKIIAVKPQEGYRAYNFKESKNHIAFTDRLLHGLWVADKETLTPINLQPETVNGISQKELFNKKKELEKQGKDLDNAYLFWVENVFWSPGGDKIAFNSNRHVYPRSDMAIWVTDLAGNTTKIVDNKEASTIILGWINETDLLYTDTSNHSLYKVNINSKEKEQVYGRAVFTDYSSTGRYVLYREFIDKDSIIASDDLYSLDLKNNASSKIDLPSGFDAFSGYYGWNDTKNKVAFYISNKNKDNYKLVIYNFTTSEIEIIDAPEGKHFDISVTPAWSKDKVLYILDGQLKSIDTFNL
jgi:hypothetical protein